MPFAGKGLTICKRSAKRELIQDYVSKPLEQYANGTHRKIDIRLPVANRRRMIMLMNLERSLIFLVGLSSVSRSLKVNSSNNDVNISTVRDSARNA